MAENNFLDTIKSSSFQDYIIEVRGYANENKVEVDTKQIVEGLRVLKEQFGFNFLSDITGSDHYTDEKRFEVSYNLVNIEGRRRMRVSCRIEEDDPSLDTATGLWESADWYEREVWDMMGIKFNDHPDLRRMFMPEDYEWHPLRKEFPLLGIPGSIPLPEKDPPKEYK